MKNGGIDLKTLNPELEEQVLARILSDSDVFQHHIQKVRKELGLSALIPYPEKPTIKELVSLTYSLPPNKDWGAKLKLLRDRTSEILDEFGLSPNWEMPIKVSILTNTLVAAYPQEEIVFFDLKDHPQIPRIDPAIEETLKNLYYFGVPALYFPTKVSKKTAMRWIDENWESIKKSLERLPKRWKPRTKDKTLVLGAWAYKKQGDDPRGGWKELADQFNAQFPDLAEDYDTPDGTDLQKAYNRYKKELKKLSPRS